MDELLKKVEKEIECNTTEGVCPTNIDYVGRLVDIHKDISNEEYWKSKKEVMSMGYGRNYNESYGRRGVPGTGRGRRYRGESYNEGADMIDEMNEHYGDYSESKEAFSRGNYGAGEDGMKSLDCMLKLVYKFMGMLESDANPEEMQLIEKYKRKIGNV